MDVQELSDEVEEVSAFYAERHGIDRTPELLEPMSRRPQAFVAVSGQARRKGRTDAELEQGFRDEIADVFAQVLLVARHFEVPIDDAIREKWSKWHPDRMSAGS